MSDPRLKKTASPARASRQMADRAVAQNREITEDERVEMFRQQFQQSALPDLPKIPGWHVCWLTTANPRDSIQARMRLGYEPLKPDDIPGWDYVTVKTGEYQGFIGVNEMLAFKLPESLYRRFMEEAHHNAPMREEEKLADTTRFMEEQAQASGSALQKGDGMSELGKARSAQFDLNA